ncbi:MAG: dienelactone hydrolase family protein [Polyangiaceae bacterium]
MATIVLFHSALGVTAGVRRFAAALGGDGDTVLTPDLFDGETFRNVEQGARKRDALGIPELMRRASAAVEVCPLDSIYAGFSMGAAAAQYLALSRPGARGLVLMHAVLPLAALGASQWPPVPVQIHTSEGDPWVDDVVVVDFARAASATVFRYPGNGHLFTDRDDPDYDAASADLLERRVREFIRLRG